MGGAENKGCERNREQGLCEGPRARAVGGAVSKGCGRGREQGLWEGP